MPDVIISENLILIVESLDLINVVYQSLCIA